MPQPQHITAALAIDALAMDARDAFDVAAVNGYRGIAFATNHAELKPEALGESARRHVAKILESKSLSLDSIRIAVPRGGLADAATIDRTIDNALKAITLAEQMHVTTVSLHAGPLGESTSSIESAVRELANQAERRGIMLALSADTAAPLAKLLAAVAATRARPHLDTARVIAAGDDPAKIAEQFASGKLPIAQLTARDAIRVGSTVRSVELGQGQLALSDLLAALREQEFRGPIVVDPRDLPDAADAAAHAAAILRPLLS